MKSNKGFTLIELLVVIAIIGILASIVLASLNTARNKGTDAAIKANLANVRAQAEIYYDANSDYGAAYESATCAGLAAGDMMLDDVTINNAVTSADSANGTEAVACASTGTAWVIAANLVSDTTAWCVDSTGASESIATIDFDAGDDSCTDYSA